MEEGEAAAQKEGVDNKCVEEQTNEDVGEVCKSSEEPEARYNRLKLFDKVMQKSLEKLIHHAR